MNLSLTHGSTLAHHYQMRSNGNIAIPTASAPGIPCVHRFAPRPLTLREGDGWLGGSFASLCENDGLVLPAGSCCGACFVRRDWTL